jgi:hypothetical protein
MKTPYVTVLGYVAAAVTLMGLGVFILAEINHSPGDPTPRPVALWVGLGLVVLWLAVKSIISSARPPTPREKAPRP